MAKFAEEYPNEKFVQTVSEQIPWSHNVLIMGKIKAFTFIEVDAYFTHHKVALEVAF